MKVFSKSSFMTLLCVIIMFTCFSLRLSAQSTEIVTEIGGVRYRINDYFGTAFITEIADQSLRTFTVPKSIKYGNNVYETTGMATTGNLTELIIEDWEYSFILNSIGSDLNSIYIGRDLRSASSGGEAKYAPLKNSNIRKLGFGAPLTEIGDKYDLGTVAEKLQSIYFADGYQELTIKNNTYSNLATVKSAYLGRQLKYEFKGTQPVPFTSTPTVCVSGGMKDLSRTLKLGYVQSLLITSIADWCEMDLDDNQWAAGAPRVRDVSLYCNNIRYSDFTDWGGGTVDDNICSYSDWSDDGSVPSQFKSVTELRIPKGVKEIGSCAFRYFKNITKLVSSGNDLKKINDGAFGFCKGLESVTIASGVEYIGRACFVETPLLKKIEFETGTEPLTISCNNLAFYNNTSGNGEMVIEELTIGRDLVFAPEATSSSAIDGSPFRMLRYLDKVTLREGVTALPAGFLESCKALRNIEVPSEVATIGEEAFRGCSGLKTVRFGKGLKSIGAKAFMYDRALTEIYCASMTPPEIQSNVFVGEESWSFDSDYNYNLIYRNATLHVPVGTADAYKATTWNRFSNITDDLRRDDALKFSSTEATATIGEEFTAPVLTNNSGVNANFSSSDPQVASVDAESGHVTLLSSGITVISAHTPATDAYDEGYASYTLTVSKRVVPVERIEITPAAATVEAEQNITLTAVIYPEDATDKKISWATSDSRISLSPLWDGRAVVAMLWPGEYTVTASCGGKSAVCRLTVKKQEEPAPTPVPVEKITLAPQTVEIEEGASVNIYATVEPDNADDKKITWSVSGEGISITSSGDGWTLISAEKAGSYKVTASCGDVTAECNVIVKEKIVLPEKKEVTVEGITYVCDSYAMTAAVKSADNNTREALIREEVELYGRTYDVTAIQESAFYEHSGLRRITVPSSVTSIGSQAFSSCPGLESLEFLDSKSPLKIKGYLISDNMTPDVYFGRNIEFDENREPFFRENINRIVTGGSMTEIAPSFFYGCEMLEEVTLGAAIRRLGDNSLRGCPALRKVTFEGQVSELGSLAFDGCNTLREISLNAPEPPVADSPDWIFPEIVYAEAILRVPYASLELYRNADVWKNFTHIQPISGQSGIVHPIIVEEGRVTVCSPDGTIVLHDADPSALGSLIDGLYIINGKKVMIRKRP